MRLAAAGVVLVLLAALFLRFTAFSGDRIRSIRWRIRLRLHPGPGFASVGELWFRWSRHAAISHGRRARPGLRFRHRLRSRTTDYAVRLGRGQWFRRAYARMEDQVLVMAAQRTGKSGIVADRILDHPGPVLATSTRADLYESTAGARALRGPVHVFNPQDVGGVPSSLAWDLLGPCKDLVMARRMASWLKVPGIGGDLQWFQQKGDVALMALLWAAAVTGCTILDVYEWVQLHGHAKCLEILADHPGSSRQLFAVTKRMFEENRTSGSIRDTIDLSLSWAILPGLAAAVTPLPGEGFSAADFTTSCGTLYMIASGDDDSPITPLFKALASWVHFEAGMAGSKGHHKRLDPPLLMALDEVTQVCLAAGTLVLTRDGYIPIEAVSVGDRVLTHAGRWRRVLAKTCNGTRPLVQVHAQGVADLRATPDHQLWIRPGSGQHAKQQALHASPVWAPAASTLGSYLSLPLPPAEENPLSEEDWWIIGRWLGDGHRSGHNNAEFFISCSHEEFPGLLNRLGSRAGYVRRNRTASQIRLRDEEGGWLKAVLKGCGSGAANKKVPAIALALRPEKAEALLSGYLSADGHYVASEDAWRASSVSRALLLGMAMVVQRARGAVASVYAGRPARKHVIEGRVVQARQEWTLCFSSGSRPLRPQGGNSRSGWIDVSGGAWKKVRAIQEIDAAEVWDLRVDGDESFVAEGCVVHNCPVDLPVMLSDSAGKGVLIEAVCHSKSQLEQRWGKHGADTVWACSGTKILLGAISDPDTLEAASKLCGTAAAADGKEPVIPPELLRMLPDWRALIIRMNLSPVVVKVRPAWRRLPYRLGRHPLPVPRLYPADAAPWLAGDPAPVPAAANGHGGKPGPLAKVGTDE